MTRKEAKVIFEDLREHKITLSDLSVNEQEEICDVAISALSEELSEDGTLTVHVKDGSKVKRVFVMGDNIFGGLYYPDSAENRNGYEYLIPEALGTVKDLCVKDCPSAFEGMTNGEVMQAVYADSEICIDETWKTVEVFFGADGDYCEDEARFDLDWWNAPYKAESEDKE